IGKTNRDLWDHYGLVIGGVIAPADAIEDPRINGLVGRPVTFPRELKASLINSIQLRGCRVALVDEQTKRVAASTTRDLRPGWNLVTFAVDGGPRSTMVFGGESRYRMKKPGFSPTDKANKEGVPPPRDKKKYLAPDRAGSP